jgi:hypothetical protein
MLGDHPAYLSQRKVSRVTYERRVTRVQLSGRIGDLTTEWNFAFPADHLPVAEMDACPDRTSTAPKLAILA